MDVEGDADLLAACRTRRVLLDAIEDAEGAVEIAGERDAWRQLCGVDDDPVQLLFGDGSQAVINRLQRQLAAVDRAIAAALMNHLLHPPAASVALMVLPANMQVMP